MDKKIAEKRTIQATGNSGSIAAGVAGGALGAVVGGNLGKSNGSAVLGAAAGATAAVFFKETLSSCKMEEPGDTSRLVGYLQAHLGAMTTAYLSGADDMALVGRWAEGTDGPDDLQVERLRSAYEAARCLVDACGAKTATSWFLGTNALLDRDSPAWVLRYGQKPEDWAFVIPAARQFVEHAR